MLLPQIPQTVQLLVSSYCENVKLGRILIVPRAVFEEHEALLGMVILIEYSVGLFSSL